jgi:hypothetical protein
VKPIFNWPQMQRFDVSESSLPEGSEIRFREPSFMEKYRGQSMAIAAALLIQAGLILFLLHERHLRRDAEVESLKRMTELAHVNRSRSICRPRRARCASRTIRSSSSRSSSTWL